MLIQYWSLRYTISNWPPSGFHSADHSSSVSLHSTSLLICLVHTSPDCQGGCYRRQDQKPNSFWITVWKIYLNRKNHAVKNSRSMRIFYLALLAHQGVLSKYWRKISDCNLHITVHMYTIFLFSIHHIMQKNPWIIEDQFH